MKKIITLSIIISIIGFNYWNKFNNPINLTQNEEVKAQNNIERVDIKESLENKSEVINDNSNTVLHPHSKKVPNKAVSDKISKSDPNRDELEKRENSEERERKEEENESRNYLEFIKSEFEILKDPATGKIPKNAHRLAMEAAVRTEEFRFPILEGDRALPSITIEKRGPFNFGGRTRTIGHDVRDQSIVIAGGNSGGIMRSTDGGNNWTRVTPVNDILSVNAVAQDPRNGQQDIWYCGTGEVNSSASGEGADYYGYGIWKSTNNGVSWDTLSSTRTGAFESFDTGFDFVSKIFVDPISGDVYAAVSDAIYKSTNQGTTWTKVLGDENLVMRTDFIKVGSNYFAALGEKGIWKSTTGDANDWTQIANSSQLGTGVGRIVLGGSPANNDWLYVFYSTTSQFSCSNSKMIPCRLQRLEISTNMWTDFSNSISLCNTSISSDNEKNINPQQGYNLAIAVKPDDASMVYFGGDQIYNLNTSNNNYTFIGGDQGSPSGSNMHVDCHFLKFTDNNTLWSCNDGGIHKTDVTGSNNGFPQGFNWTRRTENYNCYQLYRADLTPVAGGKTVGGGAQDNANNIIPEGTTNTTELGGGDGVQFAILSGNSLGDYNVITSTQKGSMYRRQGSGSFDIQPEGKSTPFNTFFLVDGDNVNYLYYMADNSKIYRSRIASTLTSGSITGDPTTGYDEMNMTLSSINIATVSRNAAFSNNSYSGSDANRQMYIGTTTGKVYRLSDPAFCTTCSPVEITPSGSSGSVSDIAINPQNNNEIMVTYSNYGVVGVYHTTNANSSTPTWTNVEGSGVVQLASVRSALIMIAGSTPLYVVGTSVGLYGTTTLSGSSTNWEKIGGGINDVGHAVVVSMRLRTADNAFVLGTHGSGLLYLTAPPPNPLPIQWISFEGRQDNLSNLLYWTNIESGISSEYVVERSSDAKNFIDIGHIAANGSSSGQNSYNFRDQSPLKGSNYYKISILENDGKTSESKIIEIENNNKFTAYPNPSEGIFTVDQNPDLYEIYDMSGRRISYNVGENNTIDIRNEPNGLYYLKSSNSQNAIILVKSEKK